jgi:hypothetical protein
MEFKGSKTEANLHTAFAEINTLIMLVSLKKKAIIRSLLFLKKLQVTRKSMLRSGSKF